MDSLDIQKLAEALAGGTPGAKGPPGEIRAADIAAALPELDEASRQHVFSLLGDAKAAEVLTEADEHTQKAVLERLPAERLARLLAEMDPDDAADVLALADPALRPAVLAGLDEDDRRAIDRLGRYEPETAGGIMTTEVVAVGSNETVESGLSKIREAEQPEATTSAFVVDPAGTLVGVVDIKGLLNARPEETVADVMSTDVIAVHVDADQEEAARIADRYHLSAVPVIDSADRLQGVITADDILDVLDEEAGEDMLRLAGTAVVHPTREPLVARLVARAPWLSVTLAGTFFAGLIIEHVEQNWFAAAVPVEGTFKLLLYFIPLIGGMAGNVGSQSSTIMVRGFATGEIDPAKPLRVLPGEVALAAVIGLVSGVLVGVATALVHSDARWLGLVVGMALPCAIVVAALAGTLVPFACRRVGVDPAYASGPFLLTMNDIAAYVIYFLVAVLLMESLGVR